LNTHQKRMPFGFIGIAFVAAMIVIAVIFVANKFHRRNTNHVALQQDSERLLGNYY